MSAAEPAPVGFIGLGQIGKPMARRLSAWPGGLVVCDALEAATRSFAERGASVAATPAEVARQATVISIMVRDDAQVTEVLTGPDGILGAAAAGTVVAIHSTVAPGTPERMAQRQPSTGCSWSMHRSAAVPWGPPGEPWP